MIPYAIVTGAAGFIGSYIVERLLISGFTVIGIDKFVSGRRKGLVDALQAQNCIWLEIDLADFDALAIAMQNMVSHGSVEMVWHMAANSDISTGVADPRVDLNNTFMTTFNILEIMRKYDIRKVVFASSSAVYGNHEGVLAEETGPLFPISNYGAMKLASEALISAAVESFLERAWIFRFPNVIGKGATHGVIFDFINKLRMNPYRLDILGDGNQQKEYLHISELLDAMFFALEKSSEKLSCFNIGTADKGATVHFIADKVIEAMALDARKNYIGGEKGWVGDVPRFSFSIEKLKRLGWYPRLTSEEAIVWAVKELLSE